jgi:alkylation response protein AidB-like acyl-CoA dehydrogenase
MNFSLNERQAILKNMAREFLERECPEKIVRETTGDAKGFSPELWQKIADLGWLGLVYPEEYGGSRGNFLDMAILAEEMGRAMFPGPFLSTVILCGLTILAAGSEEQKAAIFPKIISGELILALALTEPQSVWEGKDLDADGVTVSAVADGDEYIINGTKLFVHDALIADYFLCVTRTADGPAPEDGITLFLINSKSPGINCTLLKTTAGDKQCEVTFTSLRVPRNNMVGELNRGWSPLAKVIQQAVVLLCAMMLGGGQHALELAVDYAKSRIQFDLPIGINQHIQAHCCELLADVEGSRWITYQAAWLISENLPCDTEISLAKAWTNEAIEDAFERAHNVFAGVGSTTQDGIMPLHSKRARTAQLYLGDTAYHLEKIANTIEQWPEPEVPKGKPLGIFDTSEDEQIPAWDIWRNQTKGRLW